MNEVQLTVSAGQKPVSAFRLVFTLAFAAALSGLALASVYQITKPIIDANNARELKAAVFEVVPGATVMQKIVLRDGRLVVIPEDESANEEVIYGGYDDAGQFIGYAIQGSTPGFQDTIRLLYGYDPRTRQVTGMQVLESRETPGLGDKIWKDADFVASFRSLAVDPPITVVKRAPEGDNEVDAITGATISSKAVVKIINDGNDRWLDRLPPPGEEPAYVAEIDADASGAPDSASDESSNDGEDR